MKFILRLQKFIDFYQKELEKFNEKTPDYIEMNEEQKIELTIRETQISMLKWTRDLYFKYNEDDED